MDISSMMDLLEFDAEALYFDEALQQETEDCLQRAAERYGDGLAEQELMRAYFLEPEHPMVLVALYRFYVYQHRLSESLLVADRLLKVLARRLDLPEDWRALTQAWVGNGVMVSMTQIRLYMQALKGAGYLELRLGEYESAIERLEKLVELDANDRMGAKALLDLACNELKTESDIQRRY